MSTHNIGFYEDLKKIIFELSSNTHLISSAAQYLQRMLLWGNKQHYLSRIMRKPVYGVSDQVRYKPGCKAAEDS